MTWAYVCGIIVCIIFSHIFSSAEMSYSSCNRMRLENARDDGSKRAKVAVKIVDNFDDSLSAILIGNNLANIANSSLGSLLVLELCNGDDSYAWVSTLTITILVIIFGETIPKIIAKSSANRLALTYAYFVRGLTIIFMPLIRLVVGLIKLLTLGLKGEAEDTDEEAAVEELSSIIETAEDEDVLDEDRSELVQAAIDFSDIMASEVMTARVDVVALDIDEDMADQIETIENAPFSRIPVYEDSVDNVIGVLYLNHFLKALAGDEKPDIRSLLMPPCYVYKTMKLPAVLTELRKAKQHLAIVTDEYGGTLGILSMEDVLEQLVGEIWDDTDEIKEEILERSDGEFELDGDMSISDFIVVMKKGVVQQIGKPQDVYDDPDNLFVAKFLGTPPINVFEGTVKDGKLYIGEDAVADAAGMPQGDVFVGIRPEGFVLDAQGPLCCQLNSIEVMGRDVSIVSKHAASLNPTIRSIINADIKVDPAAGNVRFSIKPHKLFVFSKEEGEKRIRPEVK